MANRFAIKVDEANDSKPIKVQVCPEESKIYLGKRVDTANDGKPIIAVVGCSSTTRQLGLRTDTANDGKPIFAVEDPCCDAPGCHTHECCDPPGPEIVYLTLTLQSGSCAVFDGLIVPLGLVCGTNLWIGISECVEYIWWEEGGIVFERIGGDRYVVKM